VAKKKTQRTFVEAFGKASRLHLLEREGGGEFYLTTLSTANSLGHTVDGRLMEYGTLVE
jgi:hypothetical protein